MSIICSNLTHYGIKGQASQWGIEWANSRGKDGRQSPKGIIKRAQFINGPINEIKVLVSKTWKGNTTQNKACCDIILSDFVLILENYFVFRHE